MRLKKEAKGKGEEDKAIESNEEDRNGTEQCLRYQMSYSINVKAALRSRQN